MEQDTTIITPSINPRFYHIILLLIIILSAGIRLSALNRTVRWDEARNLQQFAQRPPSEFLFDFSDTNNHFLNSLMMHIEYRLLGNDEDWKIRIHVFVIGVLVTIATYYVGKELYDADVGLMASALSSVMYLLVEFSINARGYIIITLIYLLMIILINRLKIQTNRRGWIAIGVLSALGFYVSPIFLYSMGTLGVWMVLSILIENKGQQRRRIFIHFIGSMILGGILTLLYYIPVLMITYSTPTDYSESYIYRLSQPLENEAFFSGILPDAAKKLFDITHNGMTLPIIMMCGLGLFIAVIFHYKISKNRVPLFFAIVLWLSLQLIVQQTYILERTFTFLMPLYAIWIASGLISLAHFITRYRIPRFVIAISLSLIFTVSITYQLVSRQLLIQAVITAAMPNGREVAKILPNLIEPEDTVLLESRYSAILEYYFEKDNTSYSMIGFHPLVAEFFDEWDFSKSLYLLGTQDIIASLLMRKLPDQNFVFEPLIRITDNYNLYEIKRIPPTLEPLTNTSEVEMLWYVGKDSVTYDVDEKQTLIFDMYGNHWKILRYLHGQHWQDYQLSARIKIAETSYNFEDLLIHFRKVDGSNYSLGVNAGDESAGGGIGFRKDLDGAYFGYISSIPFTIELNQWYDIVIDIEGDTFTAFINGEQILQTTDTSLTNGSIGFLSPPESRVQIADIHLE